MTPVIPGDRIQKIAADARDPKTRHDHDNLIFLIDPTSWIQIVRTRALDKARFPERRRNTLPLARTVFWGTAPDG